MACRHSRLKKTVYGCCLVFSIIVIITKFNYGDYINQMIRDGESSVETRLIKKHALIAINNTNTRIQLERDNDDVTNHHRLPNCKPKHNIMFLKMHKCASSTVQNILFRFGEKHDLNFVIPQRAWKIHGPPYGNYIQLPSTEEYNIWCQHTSYQQSGIAAIMPKNTVYVTILREPAPMFESIFTYLRLDARFNITGSNPFQTFLNNPYAYYNKSPDGLAKDPMLNDLGMEKKFKENHEYIDKMIQQLTGKFNLVMLTEYFHESLILLKDLMCWSTEDVVYFTLNARAKSSVYSDAMTSQMVKQIKQWNSGDVKLYDHFNRTFWNIVDRFGRDKMRVEIEKLKTLNEQLRSRCVGHVVQNKGGVWRPHGIDIEALQLKPEADNDPQCITMALTEVEYTKRLRTLLKERHHIE